MLRREIHAVKRAIPGEQMIVKSNEAQSRTFLGVDFVLLSHGPESMVTKMLYKKGDHPPLHKHPNEQSGYVISGKYRIVIDNVHARLVPATRTLFPAALSIASKS
jgi:quercetin dioxygenase-like cupin family protein